MRKRFSEEQKLRILKSHEAGRTVKELVRELQISEQTFYNLRSKYSGMEVKEVKRLKSLEEENLRLKRLCQWHLKMVQFWQSKLVQIC